MFATTMSDQIPNPAAAVEVRGLKKSFHHVQALRGIDFVAASGRVTALLGPNGSGKTTAIKILMGLLRADAGSARLGGLDCFADRVPAKRLVGYVPDEPIYYEYLTGREVLQFVGEMHGLEPGEIAQRTGPLVTALDLAGALGDFAANYSRGMKKKLSLAAALLHAPPVLLLDEPANGLDPYAIVALRDLLRARAEAGASVLFSTHLLDQAERFCDDAIIIAAGQVVAAGPIAELKARLCAGGSLEDVFFKVTQKAEPAAT